jgi:peptide/nickel transport system ATP-binding protein
MTVPLLTIDGLKTYFFTRAGVVKAVDDVDLTVGRGEVIGLVGESGSGKSITGFSILGLVDPPGRIVDGSIKLDGEELVTATPARQRALRGREIAMVFQDPMMTLTPVLRIDTQMTEAIFAHESISRADALDRCLRALERVGIPAAAERLKAYPHQLSGGMRQRVAIAIALLHKPKLIIADEPTTALDVTIQAQIIYEMQRLCLDEGMAMIWITHDLAIVDSMADRIAVMYAGRIIEEGPAGEVIGAPAHPYTRGLLDSIPSENQRGKRLHQIPGMTPSLLNLPEGCPFRPRCPQARDICREEPPIADVGPQRWARCVAPLVREEIV